MIFLTDIKLDLSGPGLKHVSLLWLDKAPRFVLYEDDNSAQGVLNGLVGSIARRV